MREGSDRTLFRKTQRSKPKSTRRVIPDFADFHRLSTNGATRHTVSYLIICVNLDNLWIVMSDEISQPVYSRLPLWIRAQIEQLAIANAEEWVLKAIPALGDRPVAELANSDDGQAQLRAFFMKVAGKF